MILIIIELVLRVNGCQPGLIVDAPPFEQKPDSLVFYSEYIADKNGITTLNIKKRERLSQAITQQNNIDENRDYMIDALVNDYIDVNNQHVNNPFTAFVSDIKSTPMEELSWLETAYLLYCDSPINSDGFRSIEFISYPTDKLKVLLLGDSFTYGAEASNITNSFSDHLASKGWAVYNSGIIATDPAQYLGIAEKYIPKLKPDIVVVNFAMANDVVYFKRALKPNQPLIYATNAGLIFACPQGEYMTLESAYNYLLNDCYVPRQHENLFNRIGAKSVIGTKFWMLLEKMGLIPTDSEKEAYLQRVAALQAEQPVSDFYIKKIKKFSELHGAIFILVCIPFNENPQLRPNDINGLFENIDYHFPSHLTTQDRASGGHFNDQGYRKYAEYVANIIDSASTTLHQ